MNTEGKRGERIAPRNRNIGAVKRHFTSSQLIVLVHCRHHKNGRDAGVIIAALVTLSRRVFTL